MNRREFVAATAVATVAAGLTSPAAGSPAATAADAHSLTRKQRKPRYCLNMSTIRGQGLTLPEQVRISAEAGYDAIEPWMRDLYQFVEQGGRLSDLKKQLDDAGLTVESAIGFAQWIVDDPAARQAGLEEARRDMDLLRQIGGKRIA